MQSIFVQVRAGSRWNLVQQYMQYFIRNLVRIHRIREQWERTAIMKSRLLQKVRKFEPWEGKAAVYFRSSTYR